MFINFDIKMDKKIKLYKIWAAFIFLCSFLWIYVI